MSSSKSPEDYGPGPQALHRAAVKRENERIAAFLKAHAPDALAEIAERARIYRAMFGDRRPVPTTAVDRLVARLARKRKSRRDATG